MLRISTSAPQLRHCPHLRHLFPCHPCRPQTAHPLFAAAPSLPPQFNDDQLQYSRLDFVKLADIEWVLSLEKAGYDYADRVDRRGDFEQWLGAVRKGVVMRVLEYPVRQMARVFA